MKKILLTAIIALVAINGLYAQDTAQVAPQVKLELVWEKEFEGEIVDFAIGETKEQESYISAVITGGKAFVMNEKGTIIKELKGIEKKLEKGEVSNIFRLSENGKYIIHLWGYAYEEETKESRAYIYNAKGQLLWELSNIAPNHPRYVAPNGEYLLGGSLEEIILVNKTGQIKHINPFKNNEEIYHSHIAISDDSKYWALSFGLPSQGASLAVYNAKGNELWQKMIDPKGHAGSVAISHSDSFVVVVDPGGKISPLYLFLFDITGNLLWKEPVRLSGYCIYFINEDRNVILFGQCGNVLLFETTTGRLVWEYQVDTDLIIQQGISISVPEIPNSVANDGIFIAIGARAVKENEDYLLLFHKDIGFIAKYPLGSLDGKFLPLPKFSTNDYLFVARNNKVSKFNLNEER